MKIQLFGIPNCSTVKKARNWLEEHDLEYNFHDFKKSGLDAQRVESWLAQIPKEILINRKGTTWRSLDDQQKRSADQHEGAVALMLDKPSLIKRPILVCDETILVGFDLTRYESLVG